jgi:PAS domain S-box-containing protein
LQQKPAVENALMKGYESSIRLSTSFPEPIDEHVLDLPEYLLDLLPVGVCVCDRDGRIVRYNRAAADLWGRTPGPGDPPERFCGSLRLYELDGSPLSHAQSPMAEVLIKGVPVRNREIVIERPDGSRVIALLDIEALRGSLGAIVGAVNCFREAPGVRSTLGQAAPLPDMDESAAQRLAAIIESSDDAIVAKDLNGIITSWNRGAERIFGYTEAEAAGKPITIIIPPERLDEEPTILARIRSGERVDHYETVRRRKDGTLIDVSLTVSPIKDAKGRIAGASKIARDITERRRAQEQQYLLLREMNHRVKNLFTVTGSLVALSARGAPGAEELARSVQDRLAALARAHELTLAKPAPDAPLRPQPATLHALIRTIILPFENGSKEAESRVRVTGQDVPVGAASVTAFALLLHEFATNAAKYGALSVPQGHIDIQCSEAGSRFTMEWIERGGPPVAETAATEGFGGLLVRLTAKQQLRGEVERQWKRDGLEIRLTFDKARLAV